MEKRPKVLFLSKSDSTRSLMAEGFLRNLSGNYFLAASAGIEPGEPDPLALEVMSEIGIDISQENPKSVPETFKDYFRYVVTIYDSDKERSPIFPFTRKLIRWSLPDPERVEGSAEERKEAFRRVREEIRAKTQVFLEATSGELPQFTAGAV
jgi:arsenate reductase (thioredoxin)